VNPYIEISSLINQDLNLENIPEQLDYNDLLKLVEERVRYHVEHDFGLLMSYLYRLDVSEEKVRAILDHRHENEVVDELAVIILERQIARYKTKKAYQQDPIEGWEW